jgi:hypothetical protein
MVLIIVCVCVCVSMDMQDYVCVTHNCFCWGEWGHAGTNVNLWKRGRPQTKVPVNK